MAQILVFPVLLFLLALLMVITMSRQTIRFLFPYGIVFGGFLNFVLFLFLVNVLKVFTFQNGSFLNVHGQPILGAIAWTFIVMIFIYFWPKNNKTLGYFYTLAWASLATGFSQIIVQIELLEHSPFMYPLPMLLLFSAKFALITWVSKPWSID